MADEAYPPVGTAYWSTSLKGLRIADGRGEWHPLDESSAAMYFTRLAARNKALEDCLREARYALSGFLTAYYPCPTCPENSCECVDWHKAWEDAAGLLDRIDEERWQDALEARGRRVTSKTLDCPIYVRMHPTEIERAYELGLKRHEGARAAGVKDLRTPTTDKFSIDEIGMLGELVFCKATNTYPDLTINPTSGGIDCTLHSGLTVDVKTTTNLNGRLLVPHTKTRLDEHPDIYVLVKIKDDRGKVCGWEWASAVLAIPARPPDKNGEGNPAHIVPENELRRELPLYTAPAR